MLRMVFWLSVFGVVYPYLGYPILLWVLGLFFRRPDARNGDSPLPSISMIVPVHNEEKVIVRKVHNTAALQYPRERLEVVFVSDGSTDRTNQLVRQHATPSMSVVELAHRGGKAAALNEGLTRVTHEIVVFSDASIDLQPGALQQLVRPFADSRVGCVSGEDRIAGGGGEALYGRYELLLRRLESRTASIVGASGSFYAQRRALCGPFTAGMAPDFLSVLRTVEQGFRAVSEPRAVGTMSSLREPRREFERKVRTVLRGMTTLFANGRLMNPLRFGPFSFMLVSHKLVRWLVPFFLGSAMISAAALSDSPWYLSAFLAQVLFYFVAVAGSARWAGLDRTLAGRAAVYFATVHGAMCVAWIEYLRGARQELWAPSRR